MLPEVAKTHEATGCQCRLTAHDPAFNLELEIRMRLGDVLFIPVKYFMNSYLFNILALSDDVFFFFLQAF